VEERQPVGAGNQGVGEGQRRRLELERLGQLGAEEQRSVEPHAVEGDPEAIVHHRNSGVSASIGGVAVIGFAARRRDDLSRPSPKEIRS